MVMPVLRNLSPKSYAELIRVTEEKEWLLCPCPTSFFTFPPRSLGSFSVVDCGCLRVSLAIVPFVNFAC